MTKKLLPGGTIHELPPDLREAIESESVTSSASVRHPARASASSLSGRRAVA